MTGAERVLNSTPSPEAIPVLMITHKRAAYLQRALASLFRYRPSQEQYPIIASQDGDDASVRSLLQKYLTSGELARHLRFSPKKFLPSGYERLCSHYAWAFSQLFDVLGFEQAIVLEEDLEISPDFFSYFQATWPLLRADPELFCISAWNDNGKAEIASNATAVYRSDFFPGLGWMLLRSFWMEVKGLWPTQYWDDFLRRPEIRRKRQCLRPELSRTHTFGEQGVSKGQFYKTHLAGNLLNSKQLDWSAVSLAHVATRANFEAYLTQQVKSAKLLPLEDSGKLLDAAVAFRYDDKQWKSVAQRFGLMEDEKAGVRRGSFRGVVPFSWHRRPAFLVESWPLVRSEP
ncbi:unnamed protein product [Effrenium voratum]|uniref:alpha-1,3-mannosyl-glycoprotein 2-beta-N-acetylglucosaminyltransferase n=1 Tax=Effrenium voratum TaxID=2562239 RepID=A0AA36NAP9_9DINO|nr:unnamed protein product [Effrenium voratum]